MFIIKDLLAEAIYALVIFEYYVTFFEKKKIRGVYCYIWMISSALQLTEQYLIKEIPPYYRLFSGIVSLVVISYFYVGNFLKKIVFSLLYMVIAMLCEFLIAGIFLAKNYSIAQHQLAGFLATESFLLIFLKLLQYFFKNSVAGNLPWTMNVRLMLLPIGSMYIAHTLFSREHESGYHQNTFACIIILFVINVIVFRIYLQLFGIMELKRKNAIYEKEFDLLEQQMHEREEVMQEFRVQKHNLKHQITELLSLLKSSEYEKLEYSMKEMIELRSLESVRISRTDNSVIDAFLNYKSEVMEKSGITFKVAMDIPVELPFAGSDLCVILGNAIDNAIEANTRSKIDGAYIKLEIIYDGENLIILLNNTFDGNVMEGKEGWFTRKHDTSNHGFGIQSIKNTIKKYDGFYNVEIRNNIYHLELMLHSQQK